MFLKSKEKIEYPQFIADVVSGVMELFKKNLNIWIEMSDESKMLSLGQKNNLRNLAEGLGIVNIIIESENYFSSSLTENEIGEIVTFIYGKYLKEIEGLNGEGIDFRMKNILDILTKIEEMSIKDQNTTLQLKNKKDEINFLLCKAFASLFADSVTQENAHFSAFKLAKSIVQGDLMKNLLKEVEVKFK